MNAKIGLKLNSSFVLRGADGQIKKIWQENSLGRWLRKNIGEVRIPFLTGRTSNRMENANLVVDAGKAAVAGLVNGVVVNFFDYIAIGTGAVAAAATDTALGAEITTGGGIRALATLSRVTTDVTNDTAQFVLTYSFTATFAVTESGVFDAATAGTLLARQTFAAINVVSGDSLEVTWKIDVD